MSNLADDLRQAADAVAVLGSSSADLAALPDTDALAGQKRIADARRLLDTYAAWMAATIARRSRPELGHSGLAAQQGFLSPAALIQNSTGSSKGAAHKLVAVGTILADTEAAERLVAVALESPSATWRSSQRPCRGRHRSPGPSLTEPCPSMPRSRSAPASGRSTPPSPGGVLAAAAGIR